MRAKTVRKEHRRENKHIRKGWRDFCYGVTNLREEEVIDQYLEKIITQPQTIHN